MNHNKSLLKRLLALELCLAVGGIILSSLLFLYSIGEQQRITEQLFSHPFTVSNAALQFRSDVLLFRKFMLESILARKSREKSFVSKMDKFEVQMDRQLAVIRREFLGDQRRVSNIIRNMDALKKIQEPLKAVPLEDIPEKVLRLELEQASPHIEEILVDTDYVISYANLRATGFVTEGRTQLFQFRLLLALLAVLSLVTYTILSLKLRQRICRIYELESQYATFDHLTGAYNHRSLIKLGETEIKRARRHDHNLSLLMLDLDHFKSVNDTNGHDAGDSVLSQFAAVCRLNLREEDFLGRIGGEEFAILLPLTDMKGAVNIAERIRQEVAGTDFSLAEGRTLRVTVSIGLATLDIDISTIGNLLKRADEALYRSKAAGRNLVTADSTAVNPGR